MIPLKEALPFLLLELESALAHIGRGGVADQLRSAMIERWTYDEHADTAYLHLRPAQAQAATDERGGAEYPGETVSVYDELGVILDTDSGGLLTGMTILDGGRIIEQLEKGRATSPRSP